jgi:hypothetical protein
MAIFTRTAGDANGVVHVDTGVHGGGIGSIVSTGIGKHPTMFRVNYDGDFRGETGVGGEVETVIRAIAVKASVIAYQVENNASGNIHVLVEATGWNDDSEVQQAIVDAGVSPVSVSSANGFAA